MLSFWDRKGNFLLLSETSVATSCDRSEPQVVILRRSAKHGMMKEKFLLLVWPFSESVRNVPEKIQELISSLKRKAIKHKMNKSYGLPALEVLWNAGLITIYLLPDKLCSSLAFSTSVLDIFLNSTGRHLLKIRIFTSVSARALEYSPEANE